MSWPRSNKLVTFEAWISIDMFAFCFKATAPLLAEKKLIPYLTLKIQGQGHGQGQIWWSHLRPRVQSICLLFVSWQSGHFWQRYRKFGIWPWKFKVKVMAKVKPDGHIWGLEINRYAFGLWQSHHFCLSYSKFYIWPWKFKVKVMVKVKIMAKVKPDGRIWGLGFNRCACFSFRDNRTIFGWDMSNCIFDLEYSRSRSRRKSTNIYGSGNLWARVSNCAKNERNPNSCSKVTAWTRICDRRRRTNRYKNIKSPPVYGDDLITSAWFCKGWMMTW